MNNHLRKARIKLREIHKKYQEEFFNINKKIDNYLAELQEEEEDANN